MEMQETIITAIEKYQEAGSREQLAALGREIAALDREQGMFSCPQTGQEDLLSAVLPIYTLYETECNKKEHYADIAEQCRAATEQYPFSEQILAMLRGVFHNMSEEIYEQYAKVRRLLREQQRRIAAQSSKAAQDSTEQPEIVTFQEDSTLVESLSADVIFKTARSIVLELKDKGRYTSESEHKVYINGVLAEQSNKIIISLYGLLPDTDYAVKVVLGKEASKTFTVHTEQEFVTLNVKEFGAKGDGVTDDTLFLQCAVNACPKHGRVLIPEGTYKVTTLFLKSDLILELDKGAVLLAETDRTKLAVLPGRIESSDETKEYNLGTWEGNPLDCFAGIITGLNVSNVIITGQGTIDGCASKENWWNEPKLRKIAWRPRLVFLNHCTNVVLHGVTLKNSPAWNEHPYFSDNLRFIDLSILNPADSPNTDGLDPESCSNVEIVGVYFSLGDDCIAIKSGKIYMGAKYKKPSENLLIRQCCMRDGHGSITIGSEMAGGVRNLTVKDCKFLHTDRGLRIKTRRGRGKDAVIDGVLFENIEMDHVMTPVVINAFYFCDPDGHSEYVQSKKEYPVDERTPYLGEMSFCHIKAENCHAAAAYIYGLPEQKVKKVLFEDVSFSYAKEPKSGMPAMMDDAEQATKLGLFAKNIEILELRNVSIEGQNGAALITDGITRMIQE